MDPHIHKPNVGEIVCLVISLDAIGYVSMATTNFGLFEKSLSQEKFMIQYKAKANRIEARTWECLFVLSSPCVSKTLISWFDEMEHISGI